MKKDGKDDIIYFEVKVKKVLSGKFDDGLTIGVTGTDPSKVGEPPDAADALPDAFLVGFTGDTCITDDGEKGFQKFKDYKPSARKEGDRVGVAVFSDGGMSLFVNGK